MPAKILFLHASPPETMPSYVRRDFRALSRYASVEWISSSLGPGWRRGIGPTGWFPSPGLIRRIRSCDLIVQWFALPSAFVLAATAARRPALVVSGGYDVASVPEIDYGQMVHRRTRWMTQLTLNFATRILAVSRWNLSEVRRWAPRAAVELLYHGFPSVPKPTAPPREARVITMGAISEQYVERKGLDTFARASRLLPETSFVLIGAHVHKSAVERLRSLGGPNLEMPGYLEAEEVEGYLRPNAVYAQLSVHEAFGCAVAEAMQRVCTPVVSRRGALPEVVGDSGYYVEPKDAQAAAAAIQQAIDRPLGERARERIERLFPWRGREARLVEVLSELLGVDCGAEMLSENR